MTGSRATRAALTYAFDSTNGTRIWGRHVDDAGLVDVAIAPDGTRAYLTGVQLVPGPSADMLTIGYSLVP